MSDRLVPTKNGRMLMNVTGASHFLNQRLLVLLSRFKSRSRLEAAICCGGSLLCAWSKHGAFYFHSAVATICQPRLPWVMLKANNPLNNQIIA